MQHVRNLLNVFTHGGGIIPFTASLGVGITLITPHLQPCIRRWLYKVHVLYCIHYSLFRTCLI